MIRFNKYAQIILGVVLLGSLAQSAQAATFTVTKTADTADGTCDSDCSLREAVIAANATADTDTIYFQIDGVFTLSLTGTDEDTATTGDLDITAPVSIVGNGITATVIDGNDSDRLFDVYYTADNTAAASLSDMTVQNGNVNANGGAVRNNVNSKFVITNCLIQNNQTTDYSSSILSGGGGVANVGGTLRVQDTTLTGNDSTYGGALLNDSYSTAPSSSMSVVTSLLFNNTAEHGGAIENTSAQTTSSLSMTHSTISGNRASGLGGAIEQFDSYGQGTNNTISVYFATIANNSAQKNGGGALYVDSSSVSSIYNSILTNNTAGVVSDSNCNKAVTYHDYNIDSGNTCGFTGTNDQTSVTSGLDLGTLADNGGPTKTHALSTTSTAALNIISGGDCDATADQRGVSRPQNSYCDLGAYEYKDADSDGYASESDCDDDNADIYTTQTYYQDNDGDGKGSDTTIEYCSTTAPAGYVSNSNDSSDDDFSHGTITSVAGAEDGVVAVTYTDGTTTNFPIFSTGNIPVAQLASDGTRVVTINSIGTNLFVFNGYTGDTYLQKDIRQNGQQLVSLLVHDFYTKKDGEEVVIATKSGKRLRTTLYVLAPENTLTQKNSKRRPYTKTSLALSVQNKKVLLKYSSQTIGRYFVSLTDRIR